MFKKIIEMSFMIKIILIKITLSLSILGFSSLASAQYYDSIESGVWKGVINGEANCFIEIGETIYLNDIKNVLNKRVEILIGQTTFIAGHPYSVDSINGRIEYDESAYEAIYPTATGVYGMRLNLAKNDQQTVVTKLVVFEDDWQSGFNEKIECIDLKKVSD